MKPVPNRIAGHYKPYNFIYSTKVEGGNERSYRQTCSIIELLAKPSSFTKDTFSLEVIKDLIFRKL